MYRNDRNYRVCSTCVSRNISNIVVWIISPSLLGNQNSHLLWKAEKSSESPRKKKFHQAVIKLNQFSCCLLHKQKRQTFSEEITNVTKVKSLVNAISLCPRLHNWWKDSFNKAKITSFTAVSQTTRAAVTTTEAITTAATRKSNTKATATTAATAPLLTTTATTSKSSTTAASTTGATSANTEKAITTTAASKIGVTSTATGKRTATTAASTIGSASTAPEETTATTEVTAQPSETTATTTETKEKSSKQGHTQRGWG